MKIIDLINFLKLPEIGNFILSFASTYSLEKILDNIFANNSKDSLENQLVDVLNESLCMTCEEYGLEYDNTAIIETFILNLNNIINDIDEKGLHNIFIKSIGAEDLEIDDDILDFWVKSFDISISNPKHIWLYNFYYQRKNRYIYNNISKDIKERQEFLYKESIYGNSKHTLEKLFVPYPVKYEYLDERKEYKDCWTFFDNYDFFTANRLLLMLGDFGDGKSSTLKMLISRFNEVYIYVPLIDVLTFSNNIKDGIEEYCNRKYGINFVFSQLDQNQNYVLLLDGFDELQRIISETDEIKYFTQIKALLDYKNISIVLSSRGTAFIKKINITNYPQIYLKGFTVELIGDWIENWKIVNSVSVDISLKALKDRNLISVVSNKLILYMTAVIFETELKEIRIYSKAQIYKLYIDWTITGKFKDDKDIPNINYENQNHFREILQEIAYVMSVKRTDMITYNELCESIKKFQRNEIDALVYDVQVMLFTQHFFTINKNDENYISFSHKSFRQYLLAEKIFKFYNEYISNESLLYSLWYQFGSYAQFEIECFDFIKDFIADISLDDDIKKINKLSLKRTALFMDSKDFMNLLLKNQDSKILQPANAYTRSINLSVLSALINSITASELIKRGHNLSCVSQISINNIFKLCDFYIKGMNKFFLRNYSVFLNYVKYINLYNDDISRLLYQNMNQVLMRLVSTNIFGGSIQEFESYRTKIDSCEIEHVLFNSCKFCNGLVIDTTFKYCLYSGVIFENINFSNVVFNFSDAVDIRFVHCEFSDCYFDNIIIDNTLYNKSFKNKKNINCTMKDLLIDNIS